VSRRTPRSEWIRRIAGEAADNHGLVDALRLPEGLTGDHVKRAFRFGVLEPVLPAVYRIAASPRTRTQEMAAVGLWAGPGSALSHWTSAEAMDLAIPRPRRIHVTTDREIRPPSRAVSVHRRPGLPTEDVTVVRGLTVTGPERTLIDLAAVADAEIWEVALDELLRKGMAIESFIERFLQSARSGRNGTRLIREALAARRFEEGLPEDRFERRFLRVLRAAKLPVPHAQHWVTGPDGFKVRLDFAYPDARLAIEAQSYGWHSDRRSWEKDRARIADLVSLGWRVIEVTWRQLCDDPLRVVQRIARALGLPAPHSLVL
jgi:very-short-patch-repair endonuclease